jgi:hypothetical protein
MLRPTVSRPVSLGIKHLSGAYDQIFITCLTVTVLFLWGALSDERSGMSFVCAAGPCQRSLSRVRVPWDSQPYFTVSDLRLRLAGSRWRYSIPPPHGAAHGSCSSSYSLSTNHRKHHFQQFYCCVTWLSLGPRREHHFCPTV